LHIRHKSAITHFSVGGA